MDQVPVKTDIDKPRWSLLPFKALNEIVKVLTFGAIKYEVDNWRKGNGFNYDRVFSATMRHLTSWWEGEDKDPETGLSHLAHAGCNILFLLEYELTGLGNDNRYKKGKKECTLIQ